MDFEFITIHQTGIVLISGSLSNSFDRYKSIRLVGHPLLLTKFSGFAEISDITLTRAIKLSRTRFKKKPKTLQPLLKQIKTSLRTTENTLNIQTIKKYIHLGKTEPIFILWGGNTDREILKRLGLMDYKMLNIVCRDVYNNNEYFLELKTFNKTIIFQEKIGYVNKTGNFLNLKETHNLLCSEEHTTTYCHDPYNDVSLTKCIFDKILIIMNYQNINLQQFFANSVR